MWSAINIFLFFLLLLLLLFLLLLFSLFLSFTSKLDDQRFPEQPVSMDQPQGFLGRFSICQRKTNTPDERSSPSWRAHGSLQPVVTLLQSDMDWHLICYRPSRSSAACFQTRHAASLWPPTCDTVSHLAEWWRPDPSSFLSAGGKGPAACSLAQTWRTAPPAGQLMPVH